MLRKFVVGIDVGKQGALVGIDTESNTVITHKMPLNSADEISLPQLSILLSGWVEIYGAENMIVGVEDVHSIFGASAKSNFQFGRSLGVIEGYLGALNVPFVKVAPKTWQKLAHLGIPIQRKPPTLEQKAKQKEGSTDTKAMSLVACERLFPTLDLRGSSRAKKPHDGIVDGCLIAYYLTKI